jgi:hypothetical protein
MLMIIYINKDLIREDNHVSTSNNRYALEFVKEQTPEICMAAVKLNGRAFFHVKIPTEDIMVAAVVEGNGRYSEITDHFAKLVPGHFTVSYGGYPDVWGL